MRPCLCALPLSRAALRASRSPPPASSSLHHGPKSSAGASEIPPPTAALPLLETHAPPCAPPSPPCAVCCSPGTPRAPCMNTLPKSPGRTSHSTPAQSHAPECRTLKTCQVALHVSRHRINHPIRACSQPTRAPLRQPRLQILTHHLIRRTPFRPPALIYRGALRSAITACACPRHTSSAAH